MKEILRQELAELEHDINIQEDIYQELVTELNDWFIDQLENEEKYLFEVADSHDLVCPVCQLSNLVIYPCNEFELNYRCKCNAK